MSSRSDIVDVFKGTDLNVAETLKRCYARSEEKVKWLTREQEELLSRFTFDNFIETTWWNMKHGVTEEDFHNLIEKLAATFNFPDELKASLAEGTLCNNSVEGIREFNFTKGSGGVLTYGKIATSMREKDDIDVAYALYVLDYKVAPTVTRHLVEGKFLWFTTTKAYNISEEQNLSIAEVNKFQHRFQQMFTKKNYSSNEDL